MMNNYVEVCGGRDGCTSEVSHACNCGDPVVFLCSGCIVPHLSNPVTHIFISLEQAKALVEDFRHADEFYVDICKYSRLKSSLEIYIRKIESFKEKAMIAKEQIIAMIKKEFRAKLDLMSDVQNKARVQLEVVKKKMNKVTSLGDEMIRSFEARGLEGVLPNYIETFEIRSDVIQESLNKLLHISEFIPEENKSETDILYFPKHNSKQLMKYSITTNRLETIELGHTMEKEFYDSRCCILPDGNIMIVGRYNSESGATYRIDTKTYSVTKLRSINHPRDVISLICHGRYLYAFGGYINSSLSGSKKAERMEWSGNGWEELPDMKEGRAFFGIFKMDDRIYLTGGHTGSSVEYYDIMSNAFNLIPNLSIKSDPYHSAALIDDRIYIISKSQIQIYNKEFKLMETKTKFDNKNFGRLNSAITNGNKIYYNSFGSIFMLDGDAKTVSQVMPAT